MPIVATSLLFFLLNLCLRGTYADYGGGWQGGHATFYGGGDASGTMGKFIQSVTFFRVFQKVFSLTLPNFANLQVFTYQQGNYIRFKQNA